MSPALAITAFAALFFALLFPLALAAWKGVSAAPIAAVVTLLLAPIAVYQSGMFSQAELPDSSLTSVAPSSLVDAQCTEILALIDRAGAIIDRSRPPRLVVAQDRWSQLPEAAQDAVVECVQRSWPQDADAAQVEVR